MIGSGDGRDSAAFFSASEASELAAGPEDPLRGTHPSDPAARRPFPIRVGLARDPARIISWLGVRLVIAEVALVVGLRSPGAIGVSVRVAGTIVLAYVVLLTLHVLTVRLEFDPGQVWLRSIIVRRRYTLRDDPVTAMRVEPRKSIFGTQLGGFGIEIGLGQGPAKQSVDVVRLSPIARVIVIPAAPHSLAVVPASERSLRRALGRAAEHRFNAQPVDSQDAPSRVSR